jgi:hypothetical protein
MIQLYTLPEFPNNLTVHVSEHELFSVIITWDQLNRTIDGFKIIYTLSVTEMSIETKKCKLEQDRVKIEGNIPMACKYTFEPSKNYTTSENRFELHDLKEKALYKFEVNVQTPYGESKFSPPLIKQIQKRNMTDTAASNVTETITEKVKLTTIVGI